MKNSKNRYRNNSNRHQKWNYSWAAAYFITICTTGRSHFFGNISDGQMHLSSVGVIANVLWHEIKNHASNVELGEFVVMPNHIHGILILGRSDFNRYDDDRQNGNADVNDNADVGERHAFPLPQELQNLQKTKNSDKSKTHQNLDKTKKTPKPIGKNRFQNQGKNTISSIIGGYKSAVTKHANRMGIEFGWQRSFWDHIIRDHDAHQRISQYIKNNPQKWELDKFNGEVGNVVMEPWEEYGV